MSERPDLRFLDWKDLYPRLLLLTEARLRRMVWRGELQGQIPGGYSAQDFIHTAIEKISCGGRDWDPAKPAMQNLWNAISSEISNRATSAENKTTIRTTEVVINLKDYRPNPEEIAIYNSKISHLLAYLSRDPKAAKMAEIILQQGITQPAEIANFMNVEIKESENIKKRLLRQIQKYAEIMSLPSSNPAGVYREKPAGNAADGA